MAKDTKKDTKKDPKKDSKDTKSKSSTSSSSKTKATTPSSSKAATPSSRRASNPTPLTTTSAQRTSSGSRAPASTTPSSGAGVQRTGSGRQIGASPAPNGTRQVGTTPGAASTGVNATRATPAASQAPPAATRATPANAAAGPAKAVTPGSGAGAGAAGAPQGAMPPSGYGSQAGMGPGGDSVYGVNSMYNGDQGGNSAYGQGGSMYGAGAGGNSAYGQGGSMYGAGGNSAYGQGGSMYGAGQGGSMYGMNSGYGSMGGGGMGGGSMYGMNSGYGSMGGGGMGGSQMGSMYGMGGGMGGGSMYGMNPMMGSMYGNPMMGSMYGMNPMMGSMYGMGGPMMGSMYGMNPMMGSMYGMGGPMGSMYGMGSFASYGGGSMYGGSGVGSLYYSDVGDTGAGRVGGFFSSCKGPMSNDNDRLPVSGIKLKEDSRNLVRETKKAAERDRSAAGKDGDDDGKSKSRSIDGADKDGTGKDGAGKDGDNKDGKSKSRSVDGADKDDKSRDAAAPEASNRGRSLNLGKSDGGKGEEENPTQTVVLLEDKADLEQIKIDGTTVTLKDVPPYTAMEVIKADALDVKSCKAFADVMDHVEQGHNVSAIFFGCKEKQLEVIKKAAIDTVKASVERLTGNKEVKNVKLTTMAAATSSPQKGKDLLDGNAEKDLEFASNPIFGSCVQNLKKRTSTSGSEMEKVMKDVLGQKTAPGDLVIVQSIVQQTRSAGTYLCSLTLVFVRDPDVAEAVSIADDKKIPMHWLKTTLGGTSRLCLAVGLTGNKKATEEEARYLKAAATMGNTQNKAPRSGNVGRFVEYTEQRIKSILDGAGKDPEKAASAKSTAEKLGVMVKDAKDLVAKPDGEPTMYSLAKHGDTTDDDKAKPRSGKLRAVEAGAAGDVAARGLGGPNADPFTSIHRMAVVKGAAAAGNSNTVEINVSGAKKAFDVDECIAMGPSDTEPGVSKEITRMGGIFASGCNVAILGAECVPKASPADYSTWYFFGKLMTEMLESREPGRHNEFQLYMSVVRERDVIGDLLAADPSSGKGPLVVAASPLFGPHVHNTSMRKVTKPEQVKPMLAEALKKAEALVGKDGAMIVATAALKQTRQDDVVVASLFAVSAADMRPFEGVIERDSKYSRSLFSYALGGPCSTELIVTLPANGDDAVAPVLAAQRKVSHTKASIPRCGSVKEFLKYTKNNKDRLAKKVEEAKDPAERARTKNGLKRMEESEKDHEALLKNPAAVELKSYAADDGASSKPAGEAREVKATSPSAQRQPPPQQGQQASPQKAQSPQPQQPQQREGQPSPQKAQSPQEQQPQQPQQERRQRGLPAKAGTPAAVAASPAGNKATSPQTAARGAASPSTDKKGSDVKHTPMGFLAIITEEIRQGLTPKPGWSVVGSGHKLVVTDVDGPHEFTADEIINRPTRGTGLSSALLDNLRDQFLNGYNTALLTADTRGSAASLELVDRTVRHLLGKADPASEMFVSLCALKESDGTVCDTLKSGAGFTPATLSSSPLFGPSFTGVSYEKVAVAKDFVQVMDRGLRLCGESRACVVLHLVLCTPKPEEQDMMVSSFLAIMCPGDISLYRHAVRAAPKERGIIQFAIGGPCHTVFAAGLTKDPIDEGCLALPNLATALRQLPNTRAPGGSVKRFIEHTRNAIEQIETGLAAITNPEEKEKMVKYQDSVKEMLHDAEEYLANPAGRLPSVYKK